jgi:hypothetical protein
MGQPSILVDCPNCKQTCRTKRETRPGAEMRCPGCHCLLYFFVHNNGAVELRPVEDKPATQSRLPPRVGGQGETQANRRIFTSRRRNRPIGGYAPFEKSRSYIGVFALLTILGSGLLAASLYLHKIDTIAKETGRTAANPWQSEAEAKRKAFQARQKRALENFEKQQKKVKSGGAKVEDGRLSGDQTHH